MSEPTLQDRFHLIGIGGAGMSVVAELLASRGATVEGSDREDSGVLEHLCSVGVRVYVGHDASHVDPAAVVVVSTAIRERTRNWRSRVSAGSGLSTARRHWRWPRRACVS